MAKINLDQIRFYGKNDSRNTHTYDEFIKGVELVEKVVNKCEMRSLPGTKITLTFGTQSSSRDIDGNFIILPDYTETVIIDHSGIYQLDYTDVCLISIKISQKSLDIINDTSFGYFIMTIS